MTAAKNRPRVRVLGVDDLCWELAPAPWPKSRPVLELALDALGVIEDELARAVIARLATTIVDQTDQPVRIEEWSEMNTVSGTLKNVLDEDDITAGWHLGHLRCR